MDVLFDYIDSLGSYLAPIIISIFSLPILSIFLYQRPGNRQISVEIPSETPGFSSTRRHCRAKDNLVAYAHPAVRTVHDVLLHIARAFPSKLLLGSRRVIKVHEEQKEVVKVIAGKEVRENKTWQVLELSAFSWLTGQQILRKAMAIGSGLCNLGLLPQNKACIFAPTSSEWQLFAHGCFTQNMVIITAYDTLGSSGLLWSLNEPKVPVIFLNASLFPVLNSILKDTTHLRHIIYYGTPVPGSLEGLNEVAKKRGISVTSLDGIILDGESKPQDMKPPAPSDLCCIMYTSGSTGNPKGVMLTHANIIASHGGIQTALNGAINKSDIYLAFLPLSHIMEFTVEAYLMFMGCSIGYGTPRTLTDASVRNCRGDIMELRPTILAGVPVVWDTIRKGVLAKISAMSATRQRMFDLMFNLKKFSLLNNVPLGWIADAVVFNKVKAGTGGRLRFGISGGAPISNSTQLFLSVAICPVVQGYGLTETCSMAALYSPEVKFEVGIAGVPCGCAEWRLKDVAEAGYLTTHKPPRGELWVRGPAVSGGYFNQPKLTEEAFTKDGWMMTGDIAQFNPNGTLSIIDRVKNLVKLSNGEYICLERLESVYAGGKYVGRVCVYADSLHGYPVALVQPAAPAIEGLAQSLNIKCNGWEDLCTNSDIIAAVLHDLKAIAKVNKFANAETVQAVILVEEEWTPQSGLLTAAMKLKRREITERYKAQINKLYQ